MAYAFAFVKAGEEHLRLAGAVAGMTAAGLASIILIRNALDRSGAAGPFRIGPTWTLLFVLSFGVTALAWLNPQHDPRAGGGSLSPVINQELVARGVLVATVALVAWTVGYLGRPSALLRRVMSRVVRWSSPPGGWSLRTPSMPVLVYLIGSGARLLLLRAERFGYLGNASLQLNSPSTTGQLLGVLSDFAMYGLVLAAIDATMLSRSPRSKLIFWTLLALEIAIGLFAGTKLQVLLPLLAVAVVAGVRFGRMSSRSMALLVLGAIVVFPFIREYRRFLRPSARERSSPQAALVNFPHILGRTLSDLVSGEVLVTVPSDVATRLRLVDNVAVILQKTPDVIPYRPWEQQVFGPVIGLVPRAVWPSKPVLSTGVDFSREYYRVPDIVITASAVTWPGDLYRHGGLLPVVAGMLLLGALSRVIDHEVYPSTDIRRSIMYLGLFFVLLQLESDVVSLWVGVVQAVLATAVVTRLAFVSR